MELHVWLMGNGDGGTVFFLSTRSELISLEWGSGEIRLGSVVLARCLLGYPYQVYYTACFFMFTQ